LFHGWSGEAVHTLRTAKRLGIPSLIDIPTWHRHKGKPKSSAKNPQELELENAPFPHNWLNRLRISRQQMLEEYELATLLLVYSECAAESFTRIGFPKEKLFYLPLATDTGRFTPGTQPPLFRAVFTGALIKRKGVHTLLEAWSRLNLKDAELVLVGAVHDEIKPFLEQFGGDSVKVAGFSSTPEDYLRSSSIHIFPSTCEGSAKTTYDAAACGLAQISTRESGDVVIHGQTGLVVPPNDVDALAAAIEHLYRNPSLIASMGAAARTRMVENFTWDHFRARLLEAYRVAVTLKS
jgi:glycosyltransferase involved in cell wall biosynthesis